MYRKSFSTKTALLFFVFSVMILVSSFCILYKELLTPLSENDIAECTSIASDIYYNQKDALIYDVPGNYEVEVDSMKITVKPTDWRYGCVECSVKNGELVSHLQTQLGEYITACIIFAVILYIVLIILIFAIYKLCDKILKLFSSGRKSSSLPLPDSN